MVFSGCDGLGLGLGSDGDLLSVFWFTGFGVSSLFLLQRALYMHVFLSSYDAQTGIGREEEGGS